MVSQVFKLNSYKPVVAALLAFAISIVHAQSLETRVGWLDHCPSDASAKKRIFPLLAIVLPYAINATVDYASAALTKAASDNADTSAAHDDEYLLEIDSTGELHTSSKVFCLVVVKGVFNGSASAPQFKWATDRFAGLQYPYFQFEAKLVSSVNDSGVYRLAPVFIRSAKPETSSVFSSARRDYNVSVTLTDFSSRAPFASVTFNTTVESPGESGTVSQSSLDNMLSEPFSFPPSFADVTTERQKREKLAARQIVAATIIDASWEATRPKPAARFDEFSSPEVRRVLQSYCMKIQTTNKALASEHKYFDARCMHDVAIQQQSLDLAINKALTSEDSTRWARGVCPSYTAPGGDRLGGCGLSTKLDPAGLFLTNLTLTENICKGCRR